MPELPFSLIFTMLNSLTATPTPLEPMPTSMLMEQTLTTNTIQLESEYASTTGVYVTDAESGCKVYNPLPDLISKVVWSGSCKDGYSHGEGSVTWYYQNGRYEQETSLNTHDQGKYTGDITSETYNDKNKLVETFSGQVVDNANHGFGIHQGVKGNSASGYRYEGNYKYGYLNGFGRITYDSSDANSKYQISSHKSQGRGHFEGDTYVVEAIFIDGDFYLECAEEACPDYTIR